MKHELPELPYAVDALEPHISKETLEYHHGKHHKGYVDKLNAGIEGTGFADMGLEDIIREASGGIFNNAAQVWNHSFYWRCMSPDGGGEPGGELAGAIARDFGSFEAFREQFSDEAVSLFGSGWAWLVRDAGGKLSIVRTENAGTPLTGDHVPVMTCDVWEHAYYIDYRNARAEYLEAFWKLVDWDFVAGRYGS